jgi:hypothetical protein
MRSSLVPAAGVAVAGEGARTAESRTAENRIGGTKVRRERFFMLPVQCNHGAVAKACDFREKSSEDAPN